jgi:hypothetical protein
MLTREQFELCTSGTCNRQVLNQHDLDQRKEIDRLRTRLGLKPVKPKKGGCDDSDSDCRMVDGYMLGGL